MAYYICHELWLYPKYTMLLFGFMIYMVINCYNVIWGGKNYRPCVSISCNGGQGGEFNVLWRAWVSSIGLGLA